MAHILLSIVEDEAMVRESLYDFLNAQEEIEIQVVAKSVEDFLRITDRNQLKPVFFHEFFMNFNRN